MTDDSELLRRYVQTRSEPAFRELVDRHLALVYAVALRQTRDGQRAEDVAQAVFVALARKAPALLDRPVLIGWLHRCAQLEARNLIRQERHRAAREQDVETMRTILDAAEPAPDWDKVRPLLDKVLGELDERDRDAVLLRFFVGAPFAEIGRQLQLTENAARMRVDRATDKLNALLARRGVNSTAAALGVALALQPGIAAPAGLAAVVSSGALAAATGGGALWVAGAFIAMNKLKIGIAAAVVMLGLGSVGVELRANRTLQGEVKTLRGDAAEQRREQRASQNTALASPDGSGENLDFAELTRLQTRIAQLAARPEGVVDSAMRPIDDLGRATPGDALVSLCVAINRGNLDAAASSISFRGDSPETHEAFMAAFSEAVRARYRTANRLVAAALFGLKEGVPTPDPVVAYQQIGTEEKHAFGGWRVRLWVQLASGRELEVGEQMQRTTEGWAVDLRSLTDKKFATAVKARIDPNTGDPLPPKK